MGSNRLNHHLVSLHQNCLDVANRKWLHVPSVVVVVPFVMHMKKEVQPLDDDSLMENQDGNQLASHIHPMATIYPKIGNSNPVFDLFELSSILSKFFDFESGFLLFSLSMVDLPKNFELVSSRNWNFWVCYPNSVHSI